MNAPKMPRLPGRCVAKGPVNVTVDYHEGRPVRVHASYVRFGREARRSLELDDDEGPTSRAPGMVIPFRRAA